MVWIRKRDRRVKTGSKKATKRTLKTIRRVEFDPMLSAEMLRLLFDYDEHTGVLRRRSDGATFCFVSQVCVDGKTLRATRICWKIFYGEEPDGVIVHADKNPRNNRIKNLRDVVKWSQS